MYTLRPATPADAAILTWLDYVATPDPAVPPPAPPATVRRCRCRLPRDLPQRQIVMVAGHAAGVVAMEWQAGALVVTDLRLLPTYHDQGVGTALLTALLAEARGAGLALTLQLTKGQAGRHQRARLERWGFALSGETAAHWRLTHGLGLVPEAAPATSA